MRSWRSARAGAGRRAGHADAADGGVDRARDPGGDRGQPAQAVYVCGGGAYNGVLLRDIAEALGGGIPVASTDALGVAPNRVEALAFAWLGYRFTRRQPGNLPAVTGAAGLRVLGRCIRRDHFAKRKKSRPAMPGRLFY
jgi:hypothetical protein